MTKAEKIIKLLEDNGLCGYDLTRAWFELRIDDYVASCSDFEKLELTEKDYDAIIEDVTNDDEMWNAIDDSIDYFIRKNVSLDENEDK